MIHSNSLIFKLIPSLIVVFFLSLTTQAQQNLTELAFYTWKGKKTVPKPGFVILKSGTRMEGDLYLKGKDEHAEEIYLITEGREIELPPASVRSFGLIILEPTNDTDEDLYVWRGPTITGGMGSSSGSSMSSAEMSEIAIANGGKVTTKSKPMNGYVILRSGQTLKGELQLTDVNGYLTEFRIKNEEAKHDFSPNEVLHFGLELTIAEITNDGRKTSKHEAMNFYPSTIKMLDGTELKGIMAFRNREYVDKKIPAWGYKFTLMLFTEYSNTPLETIDELLVKEVVRSELGKSVTYVSYDDGYIVKGQLENSTFKDELREFHPGTITYTSGKETDAKLAQIKRSGAHFSEGLRLLYENGEIENIDTEEVESFTQTIGNETRTFILEQGVFVEQMYAGEQFILMRNPFPQSVSNWKTGLLQSVVDIATTEAANAITEKSLENNFGGDADINYAELSDEELQVLIDEGEGSNNELVQTLANGASMELAGREAKISISVKKVEWIIYNRVTKDRFIITKEEYKRQIQELLYSCETYLLMSKTEKKAFSDFEEIEKTIQFVDDCYVEAQ